MTNLRLPTILVGRFFARYANIQKLAVKIKKILDANFESWYSNKVAEINRLNKINFQYVLNFLKIKIDNELDVCYDMKVADLTSDNLKIFQKKFLTICWDLSMI